MRSMRQFMTILSLGLIIISCSSPDETISFKKQDSFSRKVDKVYANEVTMVLAVDNSFSMFSKVKELEGEMENMFTGLINSGWEVDMHVVSCAYFKAEDSDIKSASTSEIEGGSTQDKVKHLMTKASPGIDLSTKDNDADERCNQSLKKAWSNLPPKNMVNVSLVISNEDGCARSDRHLDLPNIVGDAPRSNCAPVTHGQLSAHGGFSQEKPLWEESLETWTDLIQDYSENVWVPWFNTALKDRLESPLSYADFFKNLETEGKKEVDYFSHFYVPIVVDDYKCLAESLIKQVEAEEEEYYRSIREQKNREGEDFEATPFRPMNTVGNLGYSYLDTYNLLDQDTLFDREKGDLSLCNNLSQVVGKIENEIKLRGRGLSIRLPRKLDTGTMRKVEGESFDIIRLHRPLSNEKDTAYFNRENSRLRSVDLRWILSEDETSYYMDLSLNEPFVVYDDEAVSIMVLPNRFIGIEGGDTVERLPYHTNGFIDREERIELIK